MCPLTLAIDAPIKANRQLFDPLNVSYSMLSVSKNTDVEFLSVHVIYSPPEINCTHLNTQHCDTFVKH